MSIAIRVLDLTTECGILGPQILADLGADVIAIEPPRGSEARCIGPFFEDVANPERSLFWWAYSRNKRSLALDITSDDGLGVFLRLLRTADVLIESRPGSPLQCAGLDVEDLRRIAPHLIHVTISPFGSNGPKANAASSDLALLAAGGVLALTGDEDLPPTRICVPQAFLHAGADAAVAALIALHERRSSGIGQHADISAQQSVAMATQSFILAFVNGSTPIRRMSGGFNLGAVRIPAVWAVLDGYVSLTVLFGKGFAAFTARLVEYLVEEGALNRSTLQIDWETYGERLIAGSESLEAYEKLLGSIADFISTKTKAELFREAINRRLLLAPIATIADVLGSTHLLAREYWCRMESEISGSNVPFPGAFAKFRHTPIDYRLRPPTIGEHSREVLVSELGITPNDFAQMVATGVVAA